MYALFFGIELTVYRRRRRCHGVDAQQTTSIPHRVRRAIGRIAAILIPLVAAVHDGGTEDSCESLCASD